MAALRPFRRDCHQAGLVRGCCLGLIVLAVLAVFLAVEGFRALADPGLGAPPAGPGHGPTVALIAGTLAGSAATQLVAGEHATVVLSEADLTIIAQSHNPSPDRFRNPQVRIRDGRLVVSGQTSVGPFGVTAVLRVQLSFDDSAGTPKITAQVTDYQAGQLDVPGWIGDRFAPQGTSTTFDLQTLFAADPALQMLSSAMECVAVQGDGVHVAFHRPGVSADPSRCG